MKKNILYIIVLFSFSIFIKAQTTDMPNYSPPSPNAQTFLKYGEYPVSNYTGIPNIDIPIHSINLKDISFPISISYNASGIKVDEEASRVGLGWSLNAGGVISQTIMGRSNDFEEFAYFNDTSSGLNLKDMTGVYTFSDYTILTYLNNKLPFTLPQGMSLPDFYNGMSTLDKNCGNNMEFAPDIFNYNFNGYSGKFIFLRTGKIVKEKEDNLIILPNIDSRDASPQRLKSWTIITPDGTKYNFTQTECSLLPGTVLAKQNLYPSSFYLTSIQTVNGTTINLSYKKETDYLMAVFNREQNRYASLNEVSIDLSVHEKVYLEKISYPSGEVIFEHSYDRIDFQLESRLKTINIYENGVNKCKWVLDHDYFTANITNIEIPTLAQLKTKAGNFNNYYNDSWNQKRLKLKELRQVEIDNKTNSYKFAYNETRLPTKLSSAIDHWGYYNGANNNYLIPDIIQNISSTEDKLIFSYDGKGTNREPNVDYNQAFILKKIIYPTGGSTQFSYGTNRYKADDFENDPYKKDYMYKRKIFAVSATQEQGGNNIPHQQVAITVPGPSAKQFRVKAEIVLDSYLYIGDPKLEISFRKNINDKNPEWTFTFHGNNLLPAPPITANKKIEYSSPDINLAPGSYILFVEGSLYKYIKSIDVKASGVTVYPEDYLKENYTGIGGGLRIESISNYNSEGQHISGKLYKYTTDPALYDYYSPGYSSGRLMFYPRYRKDWDIIGSSGLRGNGYSVGYSKVYVFDTDSKGKYSGGILHEYINTPDKNLFYTWGDYELPYNSYPRVKDANPSGIGTYSYSENGSLLKETIYESEGTQLKKIKETEYTYRSLGGGPNIVWGILKSSLMTGNTCPLDFNFNDFIEIYWREKPSNMATGYLYPAIIPMQTYLSQKRDIIYDKNGTASETIINYDYNNVYHYMTRETLMSAGATLKTTEYKYPPDFTSNSTMVALTDANRIKDPVEVIQTKNSKKSQVANDYSLFNGIPQIAAAKSNTGANNNLESRIIYHNYDIYGNPLYLSKDEGIKVVYLWSYQGQYPIAEIKNGTYTEVETAVKSIFSVAGIDALSTLSVPNETKLKDGSLQRALPNALVTTYTYKPLVGILTATDPSGITTYYDYDSFGRLKRTYIKENTTEKTIQTYDYHYQN